MSSSINGYGNSASRVTIILPVNPTRIGNIVLDSADENLLDNWDIEWDDSTTDTSNLRLAAKQLQESNIPVAFPTETVYGLGADATRSTAVKGIYTAKQRPSDNPLIVHVASLKQLRQLLAPGASDSSQTKSIPDIYKPLIEKFWPGPLTIILPNPQDSVLAPEVTAGLDTFGARMPRSILALSLIKLAGVPVAAPSANASTKPSPTAAEHVRHDLDGRIDTIIDGGPCDVGVESTVVDGLSHPPAILRPGGISIEQLRGCPGWEDVVLGYKDAAAEAGAKPRAPGMKYRHYSPRAKVVLFESTTKPPDLDTVLYHLHAPKSFGIIRTKVWPTGLGLKSTRSIEPKISLPLDAVNGGKVTSTKFINGITRSEGLQRGNSITISNLLKAMDQHRIPISEQLLVSMGPGDNEDVDVWEINLGEDLEEIGRGLFSALRELDQKHVDVIFVEGISDDLGSVAAAIMNRLRKAAEVIIKTP